jgi:hypothetical protein
MLASGAGSGTIAGAAEISCSGFFIVKPQVLGIKPQKAFGWVEEPIRIGVVFEVLQDRKADACIAGDLFQWNIGSSRIFFSSEPL